MASPTALRASEVRGSATDVSRGVLVADSPVENIIARAVGKGVNLHRLSAAGMPVPRWAIIGSDILQAFRIHNAIDPLISKSISRLTPDRANEVANEIAKLLAGGHCHDMIHDAIRSAYEVVGVEAVAVRSSAADEDGRELSFAGQFATYLNAKSLEQVATRVRDCWASAYSARSLRYRLMHQLSLDSIEMAVIVQAMVGAEKSGVMFTVNPVSRRSDEILISSAYGLGEGIVDGSVDSDSVVVDRGSATVKDIVLGAKDQVVEPAAHGGVTTNRTREPRPARSISDEEIGALVKYAGSIEALFGCPQDIEWAIDASGVAVLQSRSITTPVNSAPGEQRIWDNSNIIESYGEVTAPLTYRSVAST